MGKVLALHETILSLILALYILAYYKYDPTSILQVVKYE